MSVHIFVHIYIHAYMLKCVYVHIGPHMHIYTHLCTCMFIHTPAHTYIYSFLYHGHCSVISIILSSKQSCLSVDMFSHAYLFTCSLHSCLTTPSCHHRNNSCSVLLQVFSRLRCYFLLLFHFHRKLYYS